MDGRMGGDLAERDGAGAELDVEIAFGGGLRLGLVGLPAAGKETLAEALLPGCIHTEGGGLEAVAGSDLVLFVHSLERGGLAAEELSGLARLRSGLGRMFPKAFAAVATHVDGGERTVAAAYEDFAEIVRRRMGASAPIHASAPPLWILARREAAAGRTIAARSFRRTSGLALLVRRVEDLRRRKP